VLTPAYFQSGWTEFENLILQTLDPSICDKLRVEDRCQGKYDKDLGRIAELLCFKEIIKGHKLQ